MTTTPLGRLMGGLASRTAYSDLGPVTLEAAKLRVLDALGITVAGADRSAFDAAKRYLALAGRVAANGASAGGTINDLLPDRSDQISVAAHGYLLGAAAFIDNYGDTSLYSVAHPNTVVVPAALAAARERVMNGEDFLAAVTVGYQVCEVLGRTLNDGTPRMAHQVRGFRPTASCGPAGVAAAVARGWALDEDSTTRAIALACNMASGLRRTDATESAHMRLHSGEAVQRGIESIFLAQAGVSVDEGFIEGAGGFFAAYSNGELGQPEIAPRTPDDWYVADIALKIHATPHTLAAGLDCLLELVRADPDCVDQIESVTIWLPAAHAAISLSAAEVDVTTLSPAEALDSLPFCAACVIRTGEIVLPELTERCLRDREVIDLAKRIVVRVDPDLSTTFEHDRGSWPVRVDVVMSGNPVTLRRRQPRGVEVTPDVRADLRRKFDALCSPSLPAHQRDQVVQVVESIQDSDDVYADLRSVAVGGAG